MGSLPWHAGDHAMTADGWRAVVIEVGEDGVPVDWSVRTPYDWPEVGPPPWLADAVPDLAHVGTAAAWLRSCAEVTRDNVPGHVVGIRQWHAVRDAIQAAASMLVWHPDPTLTARAVDATRAYLATLETKP